MEQARQYLKRLSKGSSSNNDQSWLKEASATLFNSSLQEPDHLAVVQSLASGLGKHVAATNRVSILDKAIQLAQVSARGYHFSELDMDGYTTEDVATLQNELNALTLDTQMRKAAKSKMSDMLANATYASNIKKRYDGRQAIEALMSSLNEMHKSTITDPEKWPLSSKLGESHSRLADKPTGEKWDNFATDLRNTLQDTEESYADLKEAAKKTRGMIGDVQWEIANRPELANDDSAGVDVPSEGVARVDTEPNAWQEQAAKSSSAGQSPSGQATGTLGESRSDIQARSWDTKNEEEDPDTAATVWHTESHGGSATVLRHGLYPLTAGDDAPSAWRQKKPNSEIATSPSLKIEQMSGGSVLDDDGNGDKNPWE